MHICPTPLIEILVLPWLKSPDRAAPQQFEPFFPKGKKGGGRVYTAQRQFQIRDFAAAHRHKDWLYDHTEEILREKGFPLPPLGR